MANGAKEQTHKKDVSAPTTSSPDWARGGFTRRGARRGPLGRGRRRRRLFGGRD
jgi:hypothetical protein